VEENIPAEDRTTEGERREAVESLSKEEEEENWGHERGE